MKLLFLFFCLFPAVILAQDKAEQYKKLLDAYNTASEANDISSSLKYLELIDRLRPNSLTVLKLLAQTQMSVGDAPAALQTLERAVWINTGIVNDPAFVDLATSQSDLRRLADSISRTNVLSDVVYVLHDSNFHPEGIAFDEKRERFIFGSVRTGNIMACNKDGSIQSSFFTPARVMGSIMGMKIDRGGTRLFVATAAMPQHHDFTAASDGWSAIVQFDLKSGKELSRVTGPARHVFGDLVLDGKNQVYISDSKDPVIYRWSPGRSVLDTFVMVDKAWNLQGIAISADDKFLFVVDYISGIYRIDMATKTVVHLGPDLHGMRGCDGLYLHDRTLLAIQNGVFPRRVISLKLNGAMDKIESTEILDNNLPYRGEPTLGCLVNGHLLYLANAPWHAYDRENRFQVKLAEPVVVRSIKIR